MPTSSGTPARLRDVVSAHWRAASTWQARVEVAVGLVWWAPHVAWLEVRWRLGSSGATAGTVQLQGQSGAVGTTIQINNGAFTMMIST